MGGIEVCERDRIQVWKREKERERERDTHRSERKGDRQGREIEKDKKRFRVGERKIGRETGVVQRERERERGISIGKNKEYKKEIIFYMDVLKTIHKKISNQKMKSKERDKSILEYVQCMYNNVHTYKVPGF